VANVDEVTLIQNTRAARFAGALEATMPATGPRSLGASLGETLQILPLP
jgi:hypothetical protein